MSYPCLTIRPHLKPKEIYKRYLASEDVTERSYWHAIWLLGGKKNPLIAEQVADVIGRSPDWVRKLARRYNKEGAKGLIDKRKQNGNTKILKGKEQKRLKMALTERPADGGLWTGPKVAHWMSEKLGRTVSAVTGWHYLKFMGYSLKVPRPRHTDTASPSQQRTFKKNSKKRSRN